METFTSHRTRILYFQNNDPFDLCAINTSISKERDIQIQSISIINIQLMNYNNQ